jgi:DNA modification methylase
MIVQDKAISDIKPYQKNPRHKYDINKVAQSIKEFGFQQPIVVDRAGVIIVGHGRYEAAKSLNLKTIPVTIADLPPEKAKAYRIADNKTNEYSDWDMGLLIQEFTDLLDNNYDLELTGFDPDELEKIIVGEKDGLTDEDAVPETPEEPKAQLGDIYKLGEHRLMCGDSTKIDDVDKLINGANIDLVYTDPPYGINEKGDRTARKTGLAPNHKFKDFKDDSIQYAVDAYNICEGVYKIPRQVWWGANYYCHHLPQSNNWFVWDKRVEEKMKDTQSDCELAWVKSKWSSVRIFRHLWKGFNKDSERNQTKVHPTQKPVALAEWSFDYFKELETVLDLFGGSGSTLMACEKKQKKCYMMEFDPHYTDVIIKRWEQYTGQKAEKIN